MLHFCCLLVEAGEVPHYLAEAYVSLAVSLVQLDRLDDARDALSEARSRQPELSLEVQRLFRSTSPPEQRERYLESLRLAGLED